VLCKVRSKQLFVLGQPATSILNTQALGFGKPSHFQKCVFWCVLFLSLHKPTTHKKTQPNKVVAIALLTRGIVRLRVGEDWNVVCSLLRWFGYTGIRDFVFDFKREIGISHFGVFECYAKCGVNSYLCWANQQHQYSTHKHLDLENQVIFKSVYFGVCSFFLFTNQQHTKKHNQTKLSPLRF